MPSEQISIRELRQQASSRAESFSFRAQLESLREKTTKTGNPYYELRFADSEENLVLRIWSDSPMFPTCSQLQEKSFYEITGEFSLGNDGRNIDSRSWQPRALDETETAEVLAGSPTLRSKQAQDYAFIEEAIAAVSDPRLRAMGVRFLEKWGERFQRTAGARDYHHARRGGLVEHVAQMMRSAIKICEAYEMLNRDLLVVGILFHDVGKLWENAYEKNGFTMRVTEVSELISHIPMGMEIVNQLWREIHEDETQSTAWRDLEPSANSVRLHLLHLIAAHHGELAFGSPTVPKTPEAQALHYIDNLDAKMEMFERGYQVATEQGKNVYERVRPLPGRLVAPLPHFDSSDFDQPLTTAATATTTPEEAMAGSQSLADLPPTALHANEVQVLADEVPMVEETPVPYAEPVPEETETEPEPVAAAASGGEPAPSDDGLPIPPPPEDVEVDPF